MICETQTFSPRLRASARLNSIAKRKSSSSFSVSSANGVKSGRPELRLIKPAEMSEGPAEDAWLGEEPRRAMSSGEVIADPETDEGVDDDGRLELKGVAHALRNDSGLPGPDRRAALGLAGVEGTDKPVDEGVRLTGGKCSRSVVEGTELLTCVLTKDDSDSLRGLPANPASVGSGRTRGDTCIL